MIVANFKRHIIFLGQHYTMYPLFKAAATTSSLRMDDVEYQGKTVCARSNSVMVGLLAIIGYLSSPSLNPEERQASCKSYKLLIPFLVLIWSIVNRAYYESLPAEGFQNRVRNSTPAVVTIIYLVPEVYQLGFITVEIFKIGGWGVAIVFAGLPAGYLIFLWVKRKIFQEERTLP
ncbi:hypothetical protein DL96DRAFT_1645948 [Flagelloscypha sp. PMI_526]|nr:hypothetical protein DL96DRAFT_1645948 [Flagelloscypha sp. PMI_526]